MEDFFDHVDRRDGRKNEARSIKFFANGKTKESINVAVDPTSDQLWKVKKRLLKKLKYKNYKSS